LPWVIWLASLVSESTRAVGATSRVPDRLKLVGVGAGPGVGPGTPTGSIGCPVPMLPTLLPAAVAPMRLACAGVLLAAIAAA
jgi:hypothetical protein